MVANAIGNITRNELTSMVSAAYALFNNYIRIPTSAPNTQNDILATLSRYDSALANQFYIRLVNIGGFNGNMTSPCTSPWVLFNAAYKVGPPNWSKVALKRATYAVVACAFVVIPCAYLEGVAVTQTALLTSNLPQMLDAKLPADEANENFEGAQAHLAVKQYKWETVGNLDGTERPQIASPLTRTISWNANYLDRKWNFTSIRVAIGAQIQFAVTDGYLHGVYLAPQSSTIIIPSTQNGYKTNFKCGTPPDSDPCYYWQNWELPSGSSVTTPVFALVSFCFAGCYVLYDPYYPGTTLTVNVIAAEVANQEVVSAGAYTSPVKATLGQPANNGYYPIVCATTFPFASQIPVSYKHFEGQNTLQCCLPKGPKCLKKAYCAPDGFRLPSCAAVGKNEDGSDLPCNGTACGACAGGCGASSLFVTDGENCPPPPGEVLEPVFTGQSSNCGCGSNPVLGARVPATPQGATANAALSDADKTIRVSSGEFFTVPYPIDSATQVYLITPTGYGVTAVIYPFSNGRYKITATNGKNVTGGLTYTITNASNASGQKLIGMKLAF